MADPIEELLEKLLKEAKKRVGGPAQDNGRTVPEPAETVPEPAETVPEPAETVPEKTFLSGNGAPSEDSLVRGELLLGTYRIDSDPIRGGMGSVWKVHHTGWNVDLAMKRPQADKFATEQQKENFIRECESWMELGLHPGIVTCFYVREIAGVPAIFSEWMEGGSLEKRICDGSLYEGAEEEQAERLLGIAIRFAGGLRYAHARGMIHQDVKPDNVLLTPDWSAKVADFGLARARALLLAPGNDSLGGTVMTAAGGYTPAYCSPEQMDGEKLTRRTDIYSWAVSVMEMYRGSRPWANGVIAGLNAAEYLADTRVPLPAGLGELLVRCMAWRPEDRPHDLDGILETLFTIYQTTFGVPFAGAAEDPVTDTAGTLNNRALGYWDLGKREEALGLWREAQRADSADPDVTFNLALAEWRCGKITPTGVRESLRILQDDPVREEMEREIGGECDCSFDMGNRDDGKRFGIYVTDHSGDGRLVCGVCGEIAEMDRRNNEEISYEPYREIRRTFLVFDTETGKELFRFENTDFAKNEDIRLSRDGRYAVISYLDAERKNTYLGEPYTRVVRVVEVQTGKTVRTFTGDRGMGLTDGFLTPDNRLLCAKSNSDHALFSMETGKDLGYLPSDLHFFSGWEFLPDGRLLLTPRKDGDKRFHKTFSVYSGSGTEEPYKEEDFSFTIPGYKHAYGVFFHSGGKRLLVYTSEKIFLYGIGRAEMTLERTFKLPDDEMRYYMLQGAMLSADEKTVIGIASMSLEEQSCFWDLETGQFLGSKSSMIGRSGNYYSGQIVENALLQEQTAPTAVCRRGIPAEFRLKRAESANERVTADRECRQYAEAAKKRFEAGDPYQAVAEIDRALRVEGYAASAELLRLRARYGAGLKKTGVRGVIFSDEDAPDPAEPVSPDSEWITKIRPQTDAFRRSTLENYSSEDAYYEYSVSGSMLVGGKDNGLLLYMAKVQEDYTSPAQYDTETTYYCDGAVFNREGENLYTVGRLYCEDLGADWHCSQCFSPDGRYLLFYDPHGGLYLADLREKKKTRLSKIVSRDIGFIADDRFVVIRDDGNTVHFLSVPEGKEWFSCGLPPAYGAVRAADNDSFTVLFEGKERLCFIDWEYERP